MWSMSTGRSRRFDLQWFSEISHWFGKSHFDPLTKHVVDRL